MNKRTCEHVRCRSPCRVDKDASDLLSLGGMVVPTLGCQYRPWCRSSDRHASSRSSPSCADGAASQKTASVVPPTSAAPHHRLVGEVCAGDGTGFGSPTAAPPLSGFVSTTTAGRSAAVRALAHSGRFWNGRQNLWQSHVSWISAEIPVIIGSTARPAAYGARTDRQIPGIRRPRRRSCAGRAA